MCLPVSKKNTRWACLRFLFHACPTGKKLNNLCAEMKRIEKYITKRYVKQFHSDGRPEVLKAGWIRKMMNRLHLTPREVVEYDCGSGRILSELSRHYPAIQF